MPSWRLLQSPAARFGGHLNRMVQALSELKEGGLSDFLWATKGFDPERG